MPLGWSFYWRHIIILLKLLDISEKGYRTAFAMQAPNPPLWTMLQSNLLHQLRSDTYILPSPTFKTITGMPGRIGFSIRCGVCDLSQWLAILDGGTVMQTATCPHVYGSQFGGMRQFVLVTNQLTRSPWLRASVTLALTQTPLLPELPIGQRPA